MNKALKISGIILICLAVLVVFFIIIVNVGSKNMIKKIKENTEAISEVNLSKVEDGVYSGQFAAFVVRVKLNVEVKDHKIVKIDIIKQSCGKGYEGREVIDKVLKKQSLKVDAKTGATGSSNAILIALDKALNKK